MYTLERYRNTVAELLAPLLEMPPPEIADMLGPPPDGKFGHLSLPCFPLAKVQRRAPPKIAAELAEKLGDDLPDPVAAVTAVGPYLNFRYRRGSLVRDVLSEARDRGTDYGASDDGAGKTVVIDFSSPNIAKPFGIGHLRSTVIGAAIGRIYRRLGWNVVGINHLGDWGTSFGLLLSAFSKRGDEEAMRREPLEYAYRLYVEERKLEGDDPEVTEQARAWFRRLEDGDAEAVRLWEFFKETSLSECNELYEALDVAFEAHTGESFYNDRIEPAIESLQQMAKVDQGALVVDLERFDMPPLLLRKSDGGSTYHTRDLAAIRYRLDTYSPTRFLYVVGAPQKLHFRQLFKVVDLAGWTDSSIDLVHVDFGHIQGMKTREGNLILLREVLDEATARAAARIRENKEKGKLLDVDEDSAARAIGVGALIFNDLKQRRSKDVVFDWDQMLSFEGYTGPYLQYAVARCASIIRKGGGEVPADADLSLLDTEEAEDVAHAMGRFPEVIRGAATHNEPFEIAQYAYDLATVFNRYYARNRVLTDDPPLRAARLVLTETVRTALLACAGLLGVPAVDRM